ncbi:MAG: family 4 glycosyl hydrolase [Promethearchaeota archaeon]
MGSLKFKEVRERMGEYYKLAYIGAGSHRFSMGLFKNMVAAKELDGKPIHVALVDVDERILGFMVKILKNMGKAAGIKMKVTAHVKQREALDGANFIYKSISVGGQAAEWFDIYIPQKFGIPQNTGDTVGPGGFFRGMRCGPPVVNIAKDMAELCPKAILLNYTNPQATIVKAARRVKKDLQYIGLCHELFGGMKAVQLFNNTMTDLPPVNDWNKDLDFSYVGVNHFAWLLSVKNQDNDLYEEMRNKWKEAQENNVGGRSFNWYLLGQHDYFPYPGSRHVAEFMPEYFNYFNHKGNKFGIVVLRDVKSLGLSHRAAIHRFNMLSRDFSVQKLPKPTARGEHALEMTSDFINNEKSHHHVVNLPNYDQAICSSLPEGAILEVPGYFKDGKMHGTKVDASKMDKDVLKFLKIHSETQDLVVDAWQKGDPDILLKGLLHDPMCAFIEDPEKIEAMMWLMLYYEREWLPTFKDVIPSKEEIKKKVGKYWIDKKEIATQEEAYKVKFPPDPALKAKCKPPLE